MYLNVIQAVCLALILAITACTGKKKADDKPDTPAGDPPVPKNELTDLAALLGKVNDHLTPPPLAFSNAAELTDAGPCAGIEDPDQMLVFLRCQPNLIKSYYQQVGIFFGELVLLNTELGEQVAASPAGQRTESALPEDGEKLVVQKDTEGGFSFQIQRESRVVMHISSEGDHYRLMLDGREMLDQPTEEPAGVFQAEVSPGAADDDWNVTMYLAGIPCDEGDLNGPERVKIASSRAGGLWGVQAMTYHPRSGAPCSSEPTDASAMNIYSNVISDQTAAKAHVYLMARTVADLNQPDTHQIGKVCVNFPQYCSGSTKSYVEQVGLPFCSVAAGSVVEWSSDCAAHSQPVAAAVLAKPAVWVPPAVFFKEALSMPEAL